MFAGVGLTAAVVVAAVALPVADRTTAGFGAVLAGCGASWLASCVGAVPIALAMTTAPQRAVNAVLAATTIRFLVVLALAAPLLLGNWFPRTVLVVSLAASYMLILLTDSLLAVRMIRRYSGMTSS
jgi:hypothetical protein